jgi:hypothetical protein
MVWLVAIVTDSVIIETTMGITTTRKVPTTFSREFNDTGIKRLSISSDSQ